MYLRLRGEHQEDYIIVIESKTKIQLPLAGAWLPTVTCPLRNLWSDRPVRLVSIEPPFCPRQNCSAEPLQTPQVKDAILEKTALPSGLDTSCTAGGSQGTCTSDQLATNSGVPTTSAGLPEGLTEFRKALWLWLQCYYKGYTSEQAKWRDTSGKGLQSGVSASSQCGLRAHHPPGAWMCIHQPGSSSRPWCPVQNFYWCFVMQILLSIWLTMCLNSICCPFSLPGDQVTIIWTKAPTL